MNLLGGSHLRRKSQRRRNQGDRTPQPTHLSGLVQPYRVAKREVVLPEHPDAFVHRLQTKAINLSSERSSWAAGRAFPQENHHRAGLAPRTRDWQRAVLKRGSRASICTYSTEWQVRYFKKQYARIDPVLARGRAAVLPFDWNELSRDDPATQAFFDDAADHDVGHNGLSIPVRNRKGVRLLISTEN